MRSRVVPLLHLARGGRLMQRMKMSSNDGGTSVNLYGENHQAPPALPVDPLEASRYSLSNYPGASAEAFPDKTVKLLMAPLDEADIEIKPDGILYLPEIKYRRILNKAIGPGAWALIPRSESVVDGKTLSRDYALFAFGRFVSQARGEFESNFSKASEGISEEAAKSNALMRCCKDLGVASELWDPAFILQWREKNCVAVFAEHQMTKKKHKLWRRKDRPPFGFPWKET